MTTALALVGVPVRRVIRLTRDARDARYGLLRGYFHGADDDGVEEREQVRLRSVTLPVATRLAGTLVSELLLAEQGITLASLRRAAGAVCMPADTLRVEGGDTLVLSGTPEQLALAEERLLR